ncbi:MAG TPA: manganese efflux pump [Bacteroidales bacterium]
MYILNQAIDRGFSSKLVFSPPDFLLMPIALNILLMLCLALQTFPTFLGIKRNSNSFESILFVLIPVVAQILFFWIGHLLGNNFFYLMQDFKTIVVFIGFFIIGIRFVVDAFAVRKGKRTFKAENILQITLVSIAQSTNTFLLGLLFCFFNINLLQTLSFLGLATLIFSLSGILSNASKRNLALSSLLILSGGIFMILSSFYLAFL